MAGAGIPAINEIPDDIEVEFHVTPRSYGPHDSTGCSESYQSSGHVAVLNAIYDAVGVRIYTLPATPAKIHSVIQAKEMGKEIKQEPWDLGCKLFERLEYFEKKAIEKLGKRI
jgi:aldehyde oxidoreductase